MAWKRNAECMASRTTSLPRNENERLLMPPLIFDAGTGDLEDAVGLDEIDRVVVVLLEAGRDRQDVRVEDDVERVEARRVDEQPVGALGRSPTLRPTVSAWPCSSNAITTTAAP